MTDPTKILYDALNSIALSTDGEMKSIIRAHEALAEYEKAKYMSPLTDIWRGPGERPVNDDDSFPDLCLCETIDNGEIKYRGSETPQLFRGTLLRWCNAKELVADHTRLTALTDNENG